MIRARTILAFVLVLAGLVWIGQGTGLLKGNGFMDGDTRWALIGAILVVVGLALAFVEIRRRRQA